MCTTIIVGKAVSKTGRVIVGRVCRVEEILNRHIVAQSRTFCFQYGYGRADSRIALCL